MNGRLRFTIWHGFAASLAVHAALGPPFVVHSLALPPDEPPTLVIELQGAVAESQTEQKILQETKGGREAGKGGRRKARASPCRTASS